MPKSPILSILNLKFPANFERVIIVYFWRENSKKIGLTSFRLIWHVYLRSDPSRLK